jgi:hypothetical protein
MQGDSERKRASGLARALRTGSGNRLATESSVEQKIEGRTPLRSLRRRNDSAVGPDCRLEVRS